MKRMHRRPGKTEPARDKQIVRHAKQGKQDIGLDEDVRVVSSGESNPHDG